MKTTTGSSETWSIFFIFLEVGGRGGGGGGRSSPNDMAYFAVIVWSQFVSDFKNKHTVAKPFSLAKREMRESNEKWLRDGRSKLADTSPLTTPRERQRLGLLCGLRLKSFYVQF